LTGLHGGLTGGSIKENTNGAQGNRSKNQEWVVLLNLVLQFPYLCYRKSNLMILIRSFKMLNHVLINNSLMFIISK
jgi:hypothetical protein